MLRRRWPLFALGALLVALGGLLTAALLLVRAPFRFLDGRKPVYISPAKQVARFSFSVPERVYYSFEATEADVERAQTELRGAKYGAVYASPNGLSVFRRGPSEVQLLRGQRWSSAEAGVEAAEGWLVVLVENAPQPSFWDRFKRLVGL